jgi:protein phosphatase
VADIFIPDPSLVVLIGAAGAGKSTFAARQFDPSEILSSDAFRALIAGDPADQTVTRAAFGRLHRELAGRLALGRLSVVDATNIDRAARRALLQRARTAGLPAVAVILDLPTDIVLARNAKRAERVVEERIVRHHLARLRQTIDVPSHQGLRHEGFAQVVHLRDPGEVESARIIRVIDHPSA